MFYDVSSGLKLNYNFVLSNYIKSIQITYIQFEIYGKGENINITRTTIVHSIKHIFTSSLEIKVKML